MSFFSLLPYIERGIKKKAILGFRLSGGAEYLQLPRFRVALSAHLVADNV
jgi:hypothetical protein